MFPGLAIVSHHPICDRFQHACKNRYCISKFETVRSPRNEAIGAFLLDKWEVRGKT